MHGVWNFLFTVFSPSHINRHTSFKSTHLVSIEYIIQTRHFLLCFFLPLPQSIWNFKNPFLKHVQKIYDTRKNLKPQTNLWSLWSLLTYTTGKPQLCNIWIFPVSSIKLVELHKAVVDTEPPDLPISKDMNEFQDNGWCLFNSAEFILG